MTTDPRPRADSSPSILEPFIPIYYIAVCSVESGEERGRRNYSSRPRRTHKRTRGVRGYTKSGVQYASLRFLDLEVSNCMKGKEIMNESTPDKTENQPSIENAHHLHAKVGHDGKT